MKMGKFNILTSVLLLCLLSACGDDSETAPGPVENTPVSASDGFDTVTPNESSYVDLSNLIESGTAGAKVIFISLESKQGEGKCPRILTSSEADSPNGENVISGLGFNLTVEGAAMCEYRYEVESVALAEQATTLATAKVIVASSADNDVLLPTILVAIVIGESEETNIKLALEGSFPEDYTLSEDFSVLGDGSVTMVATDFTITYEATADGLSRVVYSLEGDIDGVSDIKMGTIDYAVSSTLNNAPTAESFTYVDDVAVNVSVDIDVASYIDAFDEDEVQLVDVDSYTATVASKNPDNLTNTVFTFEAPTDGKHYVSYMVSDHRGGFARAIVEVFTFDPDQVAIWSDIEYGLLLFSAPQTKFEMDTTGDDYQGFYNDTNYTPTLKIPTFNYTGAQTYCATRGRLPTEDELVNMSEAETPQSKWSWPIGRSYISAGGVKVVSLLDSSASAIGSDYYYVTCVDSGGLTIATETNSTVVANGSDNKKINVTFIRDASGPVVDQVLAVEVTTGNAIPSASIVTTDIEGKASFTVSNTTAEVATISVSYTNSSSEIISVSTEVTFIGDIDSASVESLVVTQDGAAANGESENTLEALVLDDNNNLVSGALVEIDFDKDTVALVEEPSTLLTDDDGVVEFHLTNASFESEDVEVTASFDSRLNGFSSKATTVYYSMIKACADGEDIDDACLKVSKSDGFSYSATPSLAALNVMGYMKDTTGYDGKTYLSLSNNIYEKNYGRFTSVQQERWCTNLGYIQFDGRDNWEVLTEAQLKILFSYLDESPVRYDWATGVKYGTNSGYTKSMIDGSTTNHADDWGRYVSCISAL